MTTDRPPTLAMLRRENAELRRIGQQLSNVAYNWGQASANKTALTEQDRKLLRDLARQWDALNALPDWMK